MTEYSRIARGSFTTAASPIAQAVNLPFQPQRVELICSTSYLSPAQYACTSAAWDIAMGTTTTFQYIESAANPWIIAADNAVSGITTFSNGISLLLGTQLQISGITKASPAVVTTASAHGLATGNVVILEGLYQSSTTGMAQISLMPFTVTVTSTTTFTVNWNTNQSNFTALSGSPTGAYVRQVLNPYLYLPGVNFISAISLSGTNVQVTTTTNHNFVVGQMIAFRIPLAYGSTQLNSLPDNSIPGQPIYYFVTALNSNTQFTCSALSSGVNAFNSNQTIASVPGLQLPQVVAAGDVNSGGTAYSGGALYPSPSFPTYTGGASTINGPAISGSFVNNTNQGFIVSPVAGSANSSTNLLTASSLYEWKAYLFDLSM